MNSPLEALNWHESKAGASDETILAQRSRFELVEKRPAPIEMNDEEMFAWLAEYCDMLVYKRPTPEYGGSFIVYCDEVRTVAPTLSEAVQMAAAKLEEGL